MYIVNFSFSAEIKTSNSFVVNQLLDYLTIRFRARDFYLNNRVFLSRNYQLILAPRKFDVLKINISPRSEAPRAYMPVLRTTDSQGNFLPHASSKILSITVNFFRWKPYISKVKFEKENRQKPNLHGAAGSSQLSRIEIESK